MRREKMYKANGPTVADDLGHSSKSRMLAELQTYLERDIDGRSLEQEVAHQPVLFYKAAQLLAEAQYDRDQAKVDLEYAMADAAQSIRDHAAPTTKLTIPEIDDRTRLDQTVQRLRDAFTVATHWHAQVSAVKEGFSNRGWSIRDTVELQNRAQSQIDIEAHRAQVRDQQSNFAQRKELR